MLAESTELWGTLARLCIWHCKQKEEKKGAEGGCTMKTCSEKVWNKQY